MNHILTKSILALAGMAITTAAANAAISYNDSDIVVAFSNQPAPPTHSGNTYLVDLGNASQYRTGGSLADGNIHTINVPNASKFLTDLAAAGITSANRTWSLQGEDNNTGAVLMSKVEPTAGTGSLPWQNGGSTAFANNDLSTMLTSFGTAAGGSTANVPNSFTQNTSDTNSYASYVFGPNSSTQAFEAYGNPEGALNMVLDVYDIGLNGSGNATRLGALDFNSSTGVIRFSSDITKFAVPEPSTTALGLLGLGVCAARRLRRPKVAV